MHSYRKDGRLFDRVISDNILAATIHIGGRITFSPDGMFYIETCELWDQLLARISNHGQEKFFASRPIVEFQRITPSPDPRLFHRGTVLSRIWPWDPKTGTLFNLEYEPSSEFPGVKKCDIGCFPWLS